MQKLALAEQIRECDRISINERGFIGCQLMEVAGFATARGILETESVAHEAAIFCGSGNNGGDGFVVARYLSAAGWRVDVFLLSDPQKLTGDAKLNFDRLEVLPVNKYRIDEPGLDDFEQYWCGDGVIVDALLGTGLSKPVTGLYARAVAAINSVDGYKVAVDIPSGLNADNGQVMGVATSVDVTYTYGLRKLGQALQPGASMCGKVHTVDIGLPPDVIEGQGISHYLMEEDDIRAEVKPRMVEAHKGLYGHLLLLAGSCEKPGAASLACDAALSSGVGLLTLASHPIVAQITLPRLPEVMTALIEDPAELVLKLPELIDGKSAVAAGPGWGEDKKLYDALLSLCASFKLPIILDADALNLLAKGDPIHFVNRSRNGYATVLTPHPKEAARLLGIDTTEVLADRVQTVRAIAGRYGAIVVLKGASTLICDGENVFVNPTGNPGMASGGSGDVLTGLIGGILAKGLDPLAAVQKAVFLHGLAGDLAADRLGERGLSASDISAAVPEIWRMWEEGRAVLLDK